MKGFLKRLYEELFLKETTTSSSLDPDSYEAFYEKDPGNEHEDVVIKEGDKTFVWNRKKSNDNITDTGDGKGFSFYLARYVYYDEYRTFVPKLAKDLRNIGFIGKISMKDKNLMIVVNAIQENENDPIRIISAYYTEEQNLINIYDTHKDKMEKLSKDLIDYGKSRTNEDILRIENIFERRKRELKKINSFQNN